MCASCLFVDYFLALLFFCLLCALQSLILPLPGRLPPLAQSQIRRNLSNYWASDVIFCLVKFQGCSIAAIFKKIFFAKFCFKATFFNEHDNSISDEVKYCESASIVFYFTLCCTRYPSKTFFSGWITSIKLL